MTEGLSMHKKKQVALLGGTFNPIHIGHIVAGQCVLDTETFDEVWVMPTGNPPHKETVPHYNDHRLAMCKLAVEGIEGFSVSDLELNREGKIYTVETFRLLNERHKGCKFWLIIGTDSLMNLRKWYDPERLLQTVNFIVVDRGGYDPKVVEALIKDYDEGYEGDFIRIKMPQIELSSSDIRHRIEAHQSVRYRIPDNVLSYIKRHQLYK